MSNMTNITFQNKIFDIRGVNLITNEIKLPSYIPKKESTLDSLLIGGLIHKFIRKKIQPLLKPGLRLLDLTDTIEKETIDICKKYTCLNKGIGFPTGVSLNECAAHYVSVENDKLILNEDDVLKIDYGIEINGWIIDSAFTISFNPKYDNLLKAVKEATYHGIKTAGEDVLICEWAKGVGEVMESYDIHINDNTYPIKVIENLGGHNIINGIIHGGTFLPAKDLGDRILRNNRFHEGVYAIETFGSTNNNHVNEVGNPHLFRIDPEYNHKLIKIDSTRKFFQKLKSTFKTLPFCDRYVQSIDNKYQTHLDILSKNKAIYNYPPLCVNKGEYTAQYEHTIYLKDGKKIILSQGEDY